MKKTITLFILNLSLLFHVQAQLSNDLQDQFQNELEQYLVSSGVVGLSAAVITTNGNWANAAGSNSASEALTPTSTFGIGSVSKTITSAVILQMVEDGLLNLDDKITDHLDTMPNIYPDITIRRLLDHTSGIYNYTNHPMIFIDLLDDPLTPISVDSVLAKYMDAPSFNPGAVWGYSNTNYLLLGKIIDQLAGLPHYQEASERFSFNEKYPSLDMPPFESDLFDMAHLWMDTTIWGFPVVDLHANGIVLNSVFSAADAAGAYASTPTDIAQWAFDLYSGELLAPETMEKMLTATYPSTNYGLGVVIGDGPCNNELIGHTGGIFYTTATFYDPDAQIAVSVHCNDASAQGVTTNLAVEIICQYKDYLTTSVEEELDNDLTVKVFPNPFQGQVQLRIQLTENIPVQIKLVNEMGAIVATKAFENLTVGEHSISMGKDIPQGMYFAQIQLGEAIITKKIVKL